MICAEPIRIMYLPDIVVLLVPRLKDTLDEVFALIEHRHDVSYSRWGLHTWSGQRHALALEINHYGIEFAVVFRPHLWDDVLPALLKTKTVGIIVDREFFHEDRGEVTPFYLDDNNVYHPTIYKVFNVDTGLRDMVQSLRDLRERWNPNGIVTYLLSTLGDSADS